MNNNNTLRNKYNMLRIYIKSFLFIKVIIIIRHTIGNKYTFILRLIKRILE